jgi:hypothetical protein
MNIFRQYVWLKLVAVVVCVAVAGLLAFNKVDGWGWFLFAALVLAPSISVKTEEAEGE